MPIFDYRCTECKTHYDVLHKGKEIIEDIQCPTCGSVHYTKLISLPSIVTHGKSSAGCDSHTCEMDKSCCGGACGLN
jgi:putative FmdB family regulatory protein